MTNEARPNGKPTTPTFVRFVENNDHEGETWNFWLQADDNDSELSRLRTYLEGNDPDEDEFAITDEELSESEVDLLVRFAAEGYMASHHKVLGRLALPADLDAGDPDGGDPDDYFYKGGIQDFFHQTPGDSVPETEEVA